MNQFGKELILTLKSLDLCILNGRSSPENNGFTSVSLLGTSVVDYNILPTKSYKRVSNFKVRDPLLIVTQNSINIDSSLPDHRFISVDLDIKASLKRDSNKPAGTNIKIMPNNYMQEEFPVQGLELLTNLLQGKSPTMLEGNIDEVYKEFCSIIDGQLEYKSLLAPKEIRAIGKPGGIRILVH